MSKAKYNAEEKTPFGCSGMFRTGRIDVTKTTTNSQAFKLFLSLSLSLYFSLVYLYFLVLNSCSPLPLKNPRPPSRLGVQKQGGTKCANGEPTHQSFQNRNIGRVIWRG